MGGDAAMLVRTLRKVMALALLLLTGCAAHHKTWNYSWGKIIAVDGNTLAKICTPLPAKWDNGAPRKKWAVVIGCYDPSERTIWVEDSCAGAQALPHELAHLDGIGDPAKSGFNW